MQPIAASKGHHSRQLVWIIAIGLCANLSGCGDEPIAPDAKPAQMARPLMPVNLFVNSGEVMDDRNTEEALYVQSKFIASGLFASIEIGVSPLPYSLVVQYIRECPFNAGEVAASLLTAFTLFIVPHPETCTYIVNARFYEGRRLVTERQFAESYRKTIQIFGYTQLSEDKIGIDRVFEKLTRDFQEIPPIPAAAAPQLPRPVPARSTGT